MRLRKVHEYLFQAREGRVHMAEVEAQSQPLVNIEDDDPRLSHGIDDQTFAMIRASIQEAALEYARRGWKVVPDHGVVARPNGTLVCECEKANCDGKGKRPHLTRWEKVASDPDTIRGWWRKWPKSNVGIVPGTSGRLVVIDIDLPDGPGNWEALQAVHGKAPETMSVRTGSGGVHLYFVLPDGYNTCGNTLPATKSLKNIDVRGVAGQVVAPPSLHIKGRQYEWINDRDPAELPLWLFDEPDRPSPAPKMLRNTVKDFTNAVASSPNARRLNISPEVHELAYTMMQDVDDNAILPAGTQRLLLNGRSGDQSAVVQSIATGASTVRFCPARLFALMEDPSNGGGLGLRKRIRSRGVGGAMDWFALSWFKVFVHRAEQVLLVQSLRNQVDRYEWNEVEVKDRRGRSQKVRGSSVKKVLLDALDLAEAATTTDPLLSQELLAKRTGLDPTTVRKALKALQKLKWVRIKKLGGYLQPTLYSLLIDKKRLNIPYSDSTNHS